MTDRCATCQHWQKSEMRSLYPDWCGHHREPMRGDEPACRQYAPEMEMCDACAGSGVGVADTLCCKCNGAGGYPAQGIEARQGGDGTAPREARKPDPKGCAQND